MTFQLRNVGKFLSIVSLFSLVAGLTPAFGGFAPTRVPMHGVEGDPDDVCNQLASIYSGASGADVQCEPVTPDSERFPEEGDVDVSIVCSCWSLNHTRRSGGGMR